MQLAAFHYFEILSLLLAIACYRGLRSFNLSTYIPLLVMVNIVELIAYNIPGNNYYMYNLLILLQAPAFLFVFSRMLRLRENELIYFRIISALTIFFILLNYFFWQGKTNFNNYSFILTQLIYIVLSGLVLLRLFMLEENGLPMLRHPYFWINAGQLLFGITLLVLLGLQPYILEQQIMINGQSLYTFLIPKATILLYAFYSIAFILCRQKIVKS